MKVAGFWKAAKLAKRVHGKWVKHKIGRRLFPEFFAERDAELAARRAEAEAAGGQFLIDEEDDDVKLKDLIAQMRTSTKAAGAGVASLIVMGVMATPIGGPVNDWLTQACTSEEGPLQYLIGAGITAVVMWWTARKSKTPKNPGVI